MSELLQVSPLLLVLASGACFLLAFLSRKLDRKAAEQELARVKDAAARGSATRNTSAGFAVEAAPRPIFRRSERRPWSQRLLSLSGYDPAVTRTGGLPPLAVLALAVGTVVLLFPLLSARLGLLPGGAVSVGVGLLAARLVFAQQRRAWQRELFRQIPDAMGLITRAIRTGLPMDEALRTVAREMPEPTRTEFTRLLGDLSIGRGVEEALLRMQDRCGLPEYGFFAVTLSLQAQTGGSLAETLENLGDLVRKRVNMAAKVRALSAEARLGAVILAAMPFLAVAVMSLIQPGYLNFFVDTPLGQQMAIVALVMSGIGMTIIRTMIRRATED
ncbi:MAG: type II secretion system F family protein [Rhodovarius sp.]|nr:type II secretion system F family protein [Rhodovarius sp.]